MANLKAAQEAKAEFLKEADTTEDEIAADVKTADAAVATVSYKDLADADQTFVVYATTESDGVKAARVADAQDTLAKDLTKANKDLDEAKAEVAKTPGLGSVLNRR